MKKSRNLWLMIVIGCLIATASSSSGKEDMTGIFPEIPRMSKIREPEIYTNEIELTEIKPFHYVYMEFEDFDHFEDFDEYLHQLMQEVKNQGPSSSIQGNLLAILFNSPIQKTRLDIGVGLGFQIPKETSVKTPLKKRQYNFKKIAKKMHTGYLGEIYNVIGPYLAEKNLEVIGPPLVKMIGIPDKDRPDLLRAEFIIPVRKRNSQSQEKNQNIK